MRKWLIEHLRKEGDYAINVKGFGKFSLVADSEASEDSLYPKKILYEPKAKLPKRARQSKDTSAEKNQPIVLFGSENPILVHNIDYSRFFRIIKS